MLTHKGTQTIETSRLILRRAIREDAEAMFRNWASDPEVTKYRTWPTYEKVETAYQILDLPTAKICEIPLLCNLDRAIPPSC